MTIFFVLVRSETNLEMQTQYEKVKLDIQV